MSWKQNGANPAEAPGIEYLDTLYSYAMVLSRNPADAEDLVQETFFRAMKAMHTLRPDSNIKGWLFTILRNIWRNQLRRRRVGPSIVELDVENGLAESITGKERNAHDIYVSKVEAEEVRAAIDTLSAEMREVILLREYEDLSYQEIATVLCCPAGTVMSRLARARTKLRKLLSGRLNGVVNFPENVPDDGLQP